MREGKVTKFKEIFWKSSELMIPNLAIQERKMQKNQIGKLKLKKQLKLH